MLKSNEIYNIDCKELFKDIPDNSIDCVCTDPPYRLTSGGCCNKQMINGHFKGRDGKQTEFAKNGKVFKNNEIDFIDWMPEIYRVLKEQTHFYCMVNDLHLQTVLNIGSQIGFIQQNILVWEKGMHTPTQYYFKNIEFIVMFRKGAAKYINNIGTFALLKFQGLRNKKHPSQKPVSLFQTLIENSTNKNDIVLDPFMGAGTTAIAALKSKRNYIGTEIDETFFDMANDNIKLYHSSPVLF